MSATPWTYAHSHALNMRYAVRQTPQGPEVMTADKVRYSPDEVRIIRETAGEITPGIHRVKRIFAGVVVDGVEGEPVG